jgi:putative NIF3 family GTP cyclohydrolase 1 type 2
LAVTYTFQHEVLAYVAAGQAVLLANHSNTERPYLSARLQPRLQKELDAEEKGWEVVVSQADADPLRTV